MSASNLEDFAGNAVNEVDGVDDLDEIYEDSQDMEIDVVDDRPEDDRVSPRSEPSSSEEDDDEIRQYSGRAGKRIGQLKYEYHEERRQKESAQKMQEEAVRYAQSVAQQNNELRSVVAQGESVILDTMKARGSSELDNARSAYRNAYESGDTDAILLSQENLNRAQQYSYMAEQQVAIVPDHIKQPTPELPAQQTDQRLAEWTSKNEWFGSGPNSDQEMTSFAYGVHQNLVNSGVNPRTDEYYKRIDERVRSVFPDKVRGNAESGRVNEVSVANPRRNSVVASAARSSNAPRKVQLTSTQVQLAKRLGITTQQYAKQLLKETR